MQKTTREKVLGLLAKGVSLTCIKRVHGLSINEIVQLTKPKCVKMKSNINSTLVKKSKLKVKRQGLKQSKLEQPQDVMVGST